MKQRLTQLTWILALAILVACPEIVDPPAPVALNAYEIAAARISKTEIRLTWTVNTPISGLALERRTDSIPYQQIATLLSTDDNFTDYGLSATSAYIYRITALKDPHETLSNEVTIAPSGSIKRTFTVQMVTGSKNLGDFSPNDLSINRGDDVIFSNVSDRPHNAFKKDSVIDTGKFIKPGEQSKPITLENPGVYDYVCTIHANMSGKITVR